MTVWWLTLIITFTICLVARITSKIVFVDGAILNQPNKLIAFMSCVILILVAGLRSGIGDTKSYMHSYDLLPNNFSYYLSTLKMKGDWGFNFFSIIIKTLISDNAQALIFVCSLITITLIFIILYKYCGLLEIGVFTFITTGNYLISMNGIRQYLVSSVLFLAFPLIYKRKFKVYFTLVLIVSTMHNSALIFIPLYFLVNNKAWEKTTKWIIALGLGIFVTYPITAKLIANFLQGTSYGSNYNEGISLGTVGAGANIIRVLVYFVPVILAYLERDKIRSHEKYYDIIVNMSVLNVIFMLLANTYWIYARYCIYFSLYMIILLCWCIKYAFDNKTRNLLYVYCITFFGFYYWYEIAVSLGQVYTSDYIQF